MATCPRCEAEKGGKAICTACGFIAMNDTNVTGTVSKQHITTLDKVTAAAVTRIVCGKFWDAVWGGGIVPSSVTLLSGGPGQGKTTLMLQIASAAAKVTGRWAYHLSAEQSPGEIRLTADRLAIDNLDRFVVLSSQGGGAEIDESLLKEFPPAIIIVDSLSALHGKDKAGQVVTCKRFKKLSVKHKAPTILIMHMTKMGDLDGLLSLQHECDTIIALDPADVRTGMPEGIGELVGLKNRFGPIHKAVYLKMGETGLAEVPPKEKKKGRLTGPGLVPGGPPVEAVETPREPAKATPAPDMIEVAGQKLRKGKPKVLGKWDKVLLERTAAVAGEALKKRRPAMEKTPRVNKAKGGAVKGSSA